MSLENIPSSALNNVVHTAAATEVVELPTGWPVDETFSTDNTNDSTEVEASWSSVSDVCVAELFASGFGIISIIGTIGNILVISSLFVNKKLRTSLNAFITSMAMGDLIFAGVHEPLSAQALAAGRWTYRPVLCTVLGAATVGSASQSLIASTLIAVNRYILISHPHEVYKSVFRPWKTALMIAASWTLSALVVLPPLVGYGELGYNSASSICDFAVDNPSTFTYFLTIPGVLVFLSNGVTVFCYLKIYQKVKQSAINARRIAPSNSRAHARQVPSKVVKQTKHMFVMFVTFCVCTTPYSIFYTFDRNMALSPCLWQALTFLFACNSSINPIIHTCRSRDYREAFRYLVCCGRGRAGAAAKVTKITVREKNLVVVAKTGNNNRLAVAEENGGNPPSDVTKTSPLPPRPNAIAVTHSSLRIQPAASRSTGYKRYVNNPALPVVYEPPNVCV